VTEFLRNVCWRLCAFAMGICCFLLGANASAGPGDLDPTFGAGGRLFINMDANAEAAVSLLQQADGKLLVGRATNLVVATSVDLSAMRLNPTGTVDASFGGDGVVSVDLPGITASTKVMGQQGFGSVVVAGRAWRDDDPNRGFFAIARYLSDGTLDSSFGSGGYILDDFGAPRATINALVVQPDGKLVVAGNVETTPGVTNAAFSRFNANGSLDPTFGQNGRLILDVAGVGRADSAYALVRRFDGRLIATVTAADANWSTDEWWHVHTILLSLTADGNVDSSFGPDGRVSLDISALQAWGTPQVGFQSDGKVVLAWLKSHPPDGLPCDLHLSRLDGSGHLDSTFGTSGFETVALGRCYVQPRIVVLPDDSILFSAPPFFDSPWDYTGYTCPCAPLVMRMTANGAPDMAFGENGAASVDLGIDNILSNTNTDFGTHLIQQTDGNIAIATTGVYDKERSTLNGAVVEHSGIAVARLLRSGASPGVIGFKSADALVRESQSGVSVYVQRTGGRAGAVSVRFATSDRSALGGADYSPSSGTLTWLDGDNMDKVITIAILGDSIVESTESLDVTLSNPTGGAFLATSRSGVDIENYFPLPEVVISSPPGGSTSSDKSGGGAVDWASIALLILLGRLKRTSSGRNRWAYP